MTHKLTLRVDAAVRRLDGAAEDAVQLGAEHWLTEANKNVPHDEGTLERSGQVSASGTEAAVSYDTPYAVKQHEDMSLHHDGKGESKWLENSGAREAGAIGLIMRNRMAGEL